MRVFLSLSAPAIRENRLLPHITTWLDPSPSHTISDFSSMSPLNKEELKEAKDIYLRWIRQAVFKNKLDMDELEERISKHSLRSPTFSIEEESRIRSAIAELRMISREAYLSILQSSLFLGYLKDESELRDDRRFYTAFLSMREKLDELLKEVNDADVKVTYLVSFRPLVEEVLSESSEYCEEAEEASVRADKSESFKQKVFLGTAVLLAVPCGMTGFVGVGVCMLGEVGLGLVGYNWASFGMDDDLKKSFIESVSLSEVELSSRELKFERFLLPLGLWFTSAEVVHGIARMSRVQAKAMRDAHVVRGSVEEVKDSHEDLLDLNWKAFDGSVEEFDELADELLSDGVIREEYLGADGYVRFARDHYEGDMQRAFAEVSSALDDERFVELVRQAVYKRAEEVLGKSLTRDQAQAVWDAHVVGRGEIGGDGVSLAEVYNYSWSQLRGKSRILSDAGFSKLEREALIRTGVVGDGDLSLQTVRKVVVDVNDPQWIKEKLLDETGRFIKEEYQGQLGYLKFVKDHYDQDTSMESIFNKVSKAFTETSTNRPNWKQFPGRVFEFEDLLRMVDQDDFIERYRGRHTGYPAFAREHTAGNMQKAYIRLSAILDKNKFKELGWQQFQGHIKEFEELPKKIIDSDGSIKEEYLGQEGQLKFALDHPEMFIRKTSKNRSGPGDNHLVNQANHIPMPKVSINVSAALDDEVFKQLRWKRFKGNATEFEKSISRILNNGSIKKEYIGQQGYLKFAKEYYNNDMNKTFHGISEVLDTETFRNLKWKKFEGTTEEFEKSISRILNNGSIKEEYIGQEGQLKFATEHYDNNMNRAFKNVSAILDEETFAKLRWQDSNGSATKFEELIGKILNNGSIKEEYIGQQGQLKFATEHYDNNMNRAFKNISAILDEETFAKLRWQDSNGSATKFEELIGKILTNGSIKDKYLGQQGYLKFVKEHYGQNASMQYVFQQVFKTLRESSMQVPNWKQFPGRVFEFEELLQLVNQSDFIERYKGQHTGYPAFAKEYADGNMEKAYKKLSAVLDQSHFKELGWKIFQGNVEEFEALSGKLLKEDGSLKEDYIGQKGYFQFAKDHTEMFIRRSEVNNLAGTNGNPVSQSGNILIIKLFNNVSAVLGQDKFKKLGWRKLQGSVEEFETLSGKLLKEDGSLKEEYIGQQGYLQFAKEHYDGDMHQAFVKLSLILDEEIFAKLNWKLFKGKAREFEELSGTLLKENGSLKKEYIGQQGYLQFAKEHYDGDMNTAFVTVSSTLDNDKFKKLDWQQFHGSAMDFETLSKWRSQRFPVHTLKRIRELSAKLLNADASLKEEYIGQQGYLQFAKKNYNGDMEKTFIIVSSVLDKDKFKELDWLKFYGSTEEFEVLSAKLLNDNFIEKEYLSPEGYLQFAREHYGGDMNKAFINVSAVLDKDRFKNLGWRYFQGSAEEFEELSGKLLKEDGSLKEKYIGQQGYLKFAREHYDGDMQKAFEQVSAVLPRTTFKNLNWEEFHGSAEEFENLFKQESLIEEQKSATLREQTTVHNEIGRNGSAENLPQLRRSQVDINDPQWIREELLDETGHFIKKEYQGQLGYLKFVKEHYAQDLLMNYIFDKVSKAFNGTSIRKPNWKIFPGRSSDFEELLQLVNQPDFIDRYRGQHTGYLQFAREYTDGNMQKAYKRLSAILDKNKFKELGWQQFLGHVKEFEELAKKILNSNGVIKEEYLGQEGYLKFALDHPELFMRKISNNGLGHSDNNLVNQADNTLMLKTFLNTSAVLDKETFKKLGWQDFKGSAKEFEELIGKILTDGTIKDKYIGQQGYLKFAKEHYGSDMIKTFINVSAVLDKKTFKKLKWQKFEGKTEEFEKLIGKILINGTLKEEYIGQQGYLKFAKKYYGGDMIKTFKNLSSVLDTEIFKQLRWQAFQGNAKEFEELLEKILNNGSIKEKYAGQQGYLKFAKEHYDGDMQKTFRNISAVLDKETFKKLKWEKFEGTAEEFEELIGKILINGTLKEEYIGQQGYLKFAKKYYGGDMIKTFKNLSSVLDTEIFKQLRWQAFQGNAKEFEELLEKILNNGSIKEKYAGQQGYLKFAKEHYNGDMQKTFVNVSLILDEEIFAKLKWKQFTGSAEKFEELSTKLFNADGILKKRYLGQKGYLKFAKEHYDGDMNTAFVKTSSILDNEIFAKLGWKQFQGTAEKFEEFAKIFNADGTLKKRYLGQKGYLKFAKEHYDGDMNTAFVKTSSILDDEIFARLDWKHFQGSAEKFEELSKQRQQQFPSHIQRFDDLSGKLLNEDGSLKEDYIGQKGYLKFAREHYKENMQKTFEQVSAVLPGSTFKRLEWRKFQGSVMEFEFLSAKLLKNNFIEEEYLSPEGYLQFAREHYKGDMHKAFINVSAILDEDRFKNLAWRYFQGNWEEFRNLVGKLIANGSLKEEYLGQKGYLKFARKYYKGDMQKAFEQVSAVLPGSTFKRLEWVKFYGRAKEFEKLPKQESLTEWQKAEILRAHAVGQGEIGSDGVNPAGIYNYSWSQIREKDRILRDAGFNKTERNALIRGGVVGDSSAAEDLSQLRRLRVDINDPQWIREELLDKTGRFIREEYQGQLGYLKFVKDHFGQDAHMANIFQKVSKAFNGTSIRRPNWKQFQGRVFEFEKLLQVVNRSNFIDRYKGQYTGYLIFTREYAGGDMQKAYKILSAILDKTKFKQLEWKQFRGRIKEFEALPGKILNDDESIKTKYIGQEGYLKFVKEHYTDNMKKPFENMSAVLDRDTFKKLKWQSFNGSAEEFEKLISKILHSDGTSLNEEYIGQEGYLKFAKQHYGGNMQKTFINVSAVLDKETFKKLEWQGFQGSAKEFEKLPGKILHADSSFIKEKYIGQEGYIKFAKEHYGGDMGKTFQNVSSVLNKETFKKLGWQQFHGYTDEFEELIGKILYDDGFALNEEFLGQAGYLKFANTYYSGGMQKTFQNISSVLNKETFKKLGWQQFHGYTDEFEELIGKILHSDGTSLNEEYIGQAGYLKFAKEHYGGDMLKTFINVSAVLDKETFNLLDWHYVR